MRKQNLEGRGKKRRRHRTERLEKVARDRHVKLKATYDRTFRRNKLVERYGEKAARTLRPDLFDD